MDRPRLVELSTSFFVEWFGSSSISRRFYDFKTFKRSDNTFLKGQQLADVYGRRITHHQVTRFLAYLF